MIPPGNLITADCHTERDFQSKRRHTAFGTRVSVSYFRITGTTRSQSLRKRIEINENLSADGTPTPSR